MPNDLILPKHIEDQRKNDELKKQLLEHVKQLTVVKANVLAARDTQMPIILNVGEVEVKLAGRICARLSVVLEDILNSEIKLAENTISQCDKLIIEK